MISILYIYAIVAIIVFAWAYTQTTTDSNEDNFESFLFALFVGVLWLPLVLWLLVGLFIPRRK